MTDDRPPTNHTADRPLLAAAQALGTALQGRPEFGACLLNDRRDGLVLFWHGLAPSDVSTSVMARFPSIDLVVRPTRFPPATLRDAAERVLSAEEVTGVAVHYPDDSGIVASVRAEADSVDALVIRLSSVAGVPVIIEREAAIPLPPGRPSQRPGQPPADVSDPGQLRLTPPSHLAPKRLDHR